MRSESDWKKLEEATRQLAAALDIPFKEASDLIKTAMAQFPKMPKQ